MRIIVFTASNAQTAQTTEIEEASDRFALEFDHVMTSEPHHVALTLIEGLTTLLRDPAMRQQLNLFVVGQQPAVPAAQALGAGTGGAPAPAGTTPTADATRVAEVEDAVQQFTLDNGGSVMLSSTVRGQIDVVESLKSVKTANDKKVTEAQAAPADSVKKTDVKAKLDEVKTAAAALKSPRITATIEGKTELDTAIAAVETAIA